MYKRIKEIRTCAGLTQQEFADKLGIKRGTIANYELGRNEPIDAVITLICDKFDISETWLRTGEGKMSIDLSREAQITKFVGEALREESPSDRQRFLNALLGATPEELHAIAEFAKRLAKEYANEKRDDP